jgi:hypothetical protein
VPWCVYVCVYEVDIGPFGDAVVSYLKDAGCPFGDAVVSYLKDAGCPVFAVDSGPCAAGPAKLGALAARYAMIGVVGGYLPK